MNSSYYKYCIVPQCKSTTIKTPSKLFIYVPNDKQIRNKWLKLASRDDAYSLSKDSRMYFCEDHFDLRNDMVNYIQFQVMGKVSQVRMRPGCTPSKFECQEDKRKRMCSTVEGPHIKKLRTGTVARCLSNSEGYPRIDTPGTSHKNTSGPELVELLLNPEDWFPTEPYK